MGSSVLCIGEDVLLAAALVALEDVDDGGPAELHVVRADVVGVHAAHCGVEKHATVII